MVTQINPAGSLPILSVGGSPTPIAARPALAPAPVVGAQVPQAGTEAAAVAQVNQHLQQAQTGLKMQVDAGTGRTVFRIIQKGTGEVVLQMPSAEVLGMSRRMRELERQTGASGALVDKEG